MWHLQEPPVWDQLLSFIQPRAILESCQHGQRLIRVVPRLIPWENQQLGIVGLRSLQWHLSHQTTGPDIDRSIDQGLSISLSNNDLLASHHDYDHPWQTSSTVFNIQPRVVLKEIGQGPNQQSLWATPIGSLILIANWRVHIAEASISATHIPGPQGGQRAKEQQQERYVAPATAEG